MTALLPIALSLLICNLLITSHASSDRPWLSGTPKSLPFLSKEALSPDTELYHFGLPSPDMSLGISTCSCILVSPPNNLDLTRPYTPISTRHTEGTFTLLVKRYPQGAMSAVFEALQSGDSLMFRQIPFNIKIQYPFDSPRCILMLAAGTGITPMYQALLRMFGPGETEEPTTRVILLFACHSHVYLKERLEEMQTRFPNHLQIVYAMSETGCRLDEALLQQICQQETLQDGEDKIFVCGPPSFYDDFCGPRHQPEVTGFLQKLGFTSKSVVKF